MNLRVISAGSNAHGQLGNGTHNDAHSFAPCVFIVGSSPHGHQDIGGRVVSMASGANHTLLLLEHHSKGESEECIRELWGCGDSGKGQLGPVPPLWPSGSSLPEFRRLDRNILDAADVDGKDYIVCAIAAAWESTYIVIRPRRGILRNSRDIVLSMGNNDHGDLGTGLSSKQLRRSHHPRIVALEKAFTGSREEAPSGFHITDIAGGPHHIIATVRLFFQGREEDVVVGWGASHHGQLGTKYTRKKHNTTTRNNTMAPNPHLISVDNASPVVSVAPGNHHTVLLHCSGRVSGLGSNRKGQLPELEKEVAVKGVQCTWHGTYLTFWDDDLDRQATGTMRWEIQAMGSHEKGQLGYDPAISFPLPRSRTVCFPFNYTTHRLIDIACGSEHVLALFARVGKDPTSVGTEVWGWGWNEHGNLGLGHSVDAHTPTMIWPRAEDGLTDKQVLGIWAGCGTSWIIEGCMNQSVSTIT